MMDLMLSAERGNGGSPSTYWEGVALPNNFEDEEEGEKSTNPYKMKLSPSQSKTLDFNVLRDYQEREKLLFSEKPLIMENASKGTLNKKVKSQNKSNLSDSGPSYNYDSNPMQVKKLVIYLYFHI
jgi:hypothetical protein